MHAECNKLLTVRESLDSGRPGTPRKVSRVPSLQLLHPYTSARGRRKEETWGWDGDVK